MTFLDLEGILYEKFGFHSFKIGQREVIESLLQRKNTLAILPTGTGKTLCYQLMGQLIEGSVLIVSPLLSLMDDQVRQTLSNRLKKVVALNSSLFYNEKSYIIKNLQKYKYIYISPETLLKKEILKKLATMNIGLFVVDEAHCVANWGVDFRPEYTKLFHVQKICRSPLTLAMTATATPIVRKKIAEQLFPDGVEEILYSVNRPNISLHVNITTQKKETVLIYLKKWRNKGIIYCATRQKTQELTEYIRQNSNVQVTYYHGGLDSRERSLIQEQFITNQLDILCATNAFGMGIDKPDVRFVIHYDCPDSLENYVQEFGRAGRDGKPSMAVLLYQEGDERIHRYFQEGTHSDRKQLISIVENYVKDSKYLPATLNDIQQKWFQGYLDQEYSIEELNDKLKRNEKEKFLQIQIMLKYVKEHNCRQLFIQKYFAEKKLLCSTKNCCDNCGSFDFLSGVEKLNNRHKTTNDKHWETILSKLFP